MRKPRAFALPTFRPFQLATLSATVPAGDNWLFEMKYDGYRCMAAIADGEVKLYSRSGKDWTDKFGFVAPTMAELPGSALLDGEICALDGDGRSNFNLLQNALGSGGPLVFFAFDILEQDGKDISGLQQIERKHRLEALLGQREPHSPVQYSQHVEGGGQAVFDALCAGGFEGTIAKSPTARYYCGDRSTAWLKVKCTRRQEFVVIGWRPPAQGAPIDVRALFLATYEGGELVYRGAVGTGFTNRDRSHLRDVFAMIPSEPLTVKGMPAVERRHCNWIQPRLLAEVAFTEITPDGTLRHPSFKGMREDKPADDVYLDNFDMP